MTQKEEIMIQLLEILQFALENFEQVDFPLEQVPQIPGS